MRQFYIWHLERMFTAHHIRGREQARRVKSNTRNIPLDGEGSSRINIRRLDVGRVEQIISLMAAFSRVIESMCGKW